MRVEIPSIHSDQLIKYFSQEPLARWTGWKQIACCLLAAILSGGCDGSTRLSGRVVGLDDKPVAGVRMHIFEPQLPTLGFEMTTEESGEFFLGLTHAPYDTSLVVTATKDGYKPFRRELMSSERDLFPRKIVLEPDLRESDKDAN